MNPSLIKKPAAYLPIAMSLTALALVLLHAARYGIIHEADEGPSALEGDHLLTQFGGNAQNNFRSSFASDVPGQVRGQTTPPLSFEGRAAKLRPPRITPPPIWAAAKTKDTLLSRAAQRNHRDPQAVRSQYSRQRRVPFSLWPTSKLVRLRRLRECCLWGTNRSAQKNQQNWP